MINILLYRCLDGKVTLINGLINEDSVGNFEYLAQLYPDHSFDDMYEVNWYIKSVSSSQLTAYVMDENTVPEIYRKLINLEILLIN